ncbi:hypothetical protein D3C72_1770960 [compost metagenome]
MRFGLGSNSRFFQRALQFRLNLCLVQRKTTHRQVGAFAWVAGPPLFDQIRCALASIRAQDAQAGLAREAPAAGEIPVIVEVQRGQ